MQLLKYKTHKIFFITGNKLWVRQYTCVLQLRKFNDFIIDYYIFYSPIGKKDWKGEEKLFIGYSE